MIYSRLDELTSGPMGSLRLCDTRRAFFIIIIVGMTATAKHQNNALILQKQLWCNN